MLNKSELAAYPAALYESIRDLSQGKPLSGLTKEVSESTQSALVRHGLVARSPFEIYVPMDELERAALQVGVFSSGGAFVADTTIQELDPVLRAQSICVAAGAVEMNNLSGNVTLPVERSAATFSLYPEAAGTDISSSDGTIGSVQLTPHRAATYSSITGDVNALAPNFGLALLKSLNAGAAALKDRQALVGSGVSGECLGLFSRTDLTNSVSFSGAASWTKIVGANGFENLLLNANVDPSAISFAAHNNVKARWRTIQKFSSDAGAGTLWEADEDSVAGHRAFTSTSIGSTKVCAGDFSRMILATWGPGIRLLVNNYTQSLSGKILFICELLMDTAITKVESFVVGSDSAVQ